MHMNSLICRVGCQQYNKTCQHHPPPPHLPKKKNNNKKCQACKWFVTFLDTICTFLSKIFPVWHVVTSFCFLCAFQLTTVARLTSSSVPITAAYPRGGFVMEPMTVEIMKMSLIKHAQVELYSLIHIKQIHPPISASHTAKSFYNYCGFFIFQKWNVSIIH